MKPNILASYIDTFVYIDDASTSLDKCKHTKFVYDDRTIIGYMKVTYRGEGLFAAPTIYQLGVGEHYRWCASEWSTIPPDPLWRVLGDDGVLVTKVRVFNLNFDNTPFEHQSRQNHHQDGPTRCVGSQVPPNPALDILARNERHMWQGTGKTFIPFKRPHPKGYQGVWMKPCLDVRKISWDIYVYDDFTSGHALEVCYY